MKGGEKMKKILSVIAIIGILSLTITSVCAKSILNQTLIKGTYIATLIKYDTDGIFHTSVYATSINADRIDVETLVQRTGSTGKWETKGRKTDLVTETYKSYPYNINLVTTEDTRAVWSNNTAGTKLVGNFYINNGYE